MRWNMLKHNLLGLAVFLATVHGDRADRSSMQFCEGGSAFRFGVPHASTAPGLPCSTTNVLRVTTGESGFVTMGTT